MPLRSLLYTPALLIFSACSGQENSSIKANDSVSVTAVTIMSDVENYYRQHSGNDQPSESIGTVSDGKLIHGKLVPFSGKNFQYFDTVSYLAGRAFTNDKVAKALINTYQHLETARPKRKFFIMECSNQNGGRLYPHRTHQNGLSVDLMMPLVKDSMEYYGLDTIGKEHYWLDFDNTGHYTGDPTVSIDLNLVAMHLLELERQSRLLGLKISKVIIKTELRDELFATAYGKKLKTSGIYITQHLSPLINSLHDDHYHVDFEKIN